jgi:hypothetical protein
MKKLSLKNNSSLSEAYTPGYILTNWLIAMTDFHSYYHQLAICTSETMIGQDWNTKKPVYIGQCSVSLLVELISTMREELKNLAQDIDQLDELRPSSIVKNYKKLTAHTRVLNQLNQLAQNRLYLVTLPSS